MVLINIIGNNILANMNLTKKTAVVTGGTSGMGLGVAKMLVSKGY